jgi:hypothetical protein
MQRGDPKACAYRKPHSAVFTDVTLLHCAQNLPPVDTENPVRSENTEVPIIREIMVATTMSSLFVALFTLLASTFRTRAALQA